MKINIICSPDEYEILKSFAAHFFDETIKEAYSFGDAAAPFVFEFNSEKTDYDAQIICCPPVGDEPFFCENTEYLLRPLYYDEFKSAMQRINGGKCEARKPLVFGKLSPLYILPHHIVYCDTDGHYIRLHTLDSFIPSPECRDICRMRPSDYTGLNDDRIIRLRMTFGQACEMLSADKRFIFPRFGLAVNMEYIREICGYDFILISGVSVKPRIRDAAAILQRTAEYRLQKFMQK